MSGFEIITITFSFVIGLGMAHVLRTVAYVVRERSQFQLHWIPFSVAAIIIFFQVQFWFGLVVINSLMEFWTWPVYSLMLLLAISVFLSGGTVLPPPGSSIPDSLMDDFNQRGRISLVFLAIYLVGWIVVGIVFWKPEFIHLVIVNGAMSGVLLLAYFARENRQRVILHILLIAMTIYGSRTVWTTPNLQMPL